MYKAYIDGEQVYKGDSIDKVLFKIFEYSKKHRSMIDIIVYEDDIQIFRICTFENMLAFFLDKNDILDYKQKNQLIFNLTNK